jgi:hypothetical protein
VRNARGRHACQRCIGESQRRRLGRLRMVPTEGGIAERLHSTAGCSVLFVVGSDECEAGTEFSLQRRGVIPLHRQPAALLRAIWGERREDYSPARSDCRAQTVHVSRAFFSIRKKVKHGAVVPDIHRLDVPLGRDVCLNPSHSSSGIAQSRLRARKRGRRHVQHCYAPGVPFQQSIHETGVPASDIDDSRGRCESGSVNQPQRDRWIGLIPAHFG